MKKAKYSDKQIIVNILSKSFDQNKSINSIIKQDHKRNSRIRNLIEYSFEVCFLSGEIYLSDDNKGCVFLLQSDKKKTTIKTIILDLKLALTVIGIERIFTILKREAKIKSQHPKTPFYHLWYIGVDPEYQKKGLGSELLQEVLEKCNTEKKPLYLETSTYRNISWYEKFGFSIYNQVNFGYKLYMLKWL